MPVFAFLCLPEDLQLAVIALLDWPTLTSLRLTSKALSYSMPTSRLPRYYAACKKQVQLDEFAVLRLLHATFPEGHRNHYRQCAKNDTTVHHALPSFPLNLTNTHTHPRHSRKPTYLYYLPCYTCLRWLYSRETGPVRDFEDDADDSPKLAERLRRFRDNCFAGEGRILLDQPHHFSHIPMKRICITCGIRSGRYVRNMRVGGFQICAYCGTPEPQPRRLALIDYRCLPSKNTRLCVACRTMPAVAQMSELQFRHELFWGRYEKGMRGGKKARVQEGIRRRAQLGLASGGDEELLKQVDEAGKWCPVMRESRFCSCHKRWTEQDIAEAPQNPDPRKPFFAHVEWVGIVPIRRD